MNLRFLTYFPPLDSTFLRKLDARAEEGDDDGNEKQEEEEWKDGNFWEFFTSGQVIFIPSTTKFFPFSLNNLIANQLIIR
jgi:hypothetical protein